MKAIKFAGLVAVLLASTAMALPTTADVSFGISGSASNYNGDVAYDLGAIPKDTGDAWITYAQSVAVTGDNLGLAGFALGMGVYKVEGATETIVAGTFPDETDGSRYWIPGYKSLAGEGGTVKDDGGNRGPGLSTLPKLGYPATDNKLFVSNIGTGITDFTPFVKTKTGYAGAQTWGVGLDDRKANLLATGYAEYPTMGGYFDISGFAPGTYVVRLFPGTASVLQSGLNLNSGPTQNGVTWSVPLDHQSGSALSFTIVPEPATLLLLAGAGFLYRRRHA